MATMQTPQSMDDMGRRIDFLARPKRFAPGFERDRRSVYWVEREPSRPAPGGTTASIATTRVEQLAQHRNPVQQWRGDRITPIWAVSDGAQKAAATKRVVYLARHKDVNPKHRMERSPYYVLRDSSGVCTCPSARIEHLAEHKDRRDKFEVEEKEWGQYFHVPGPALIANASERVEQLAEPKQNHKDFSGEKPVQWPISEQALTSLASLRLQQLSRPRSHTMIRDDYNPYKVTPAARKAHPTPRVEELCAPIPRKQRTKKIV